MAGFSKGCEDTHSLYHVVECFLHDSEQRPKAQGGEPRRIREDLANITLDHDVNSIDANCPAATNNRFPISFYIALYDATIYDVMICKLF